MADDATKFINAAIYSALSTDQALQNYYASLLGAGGAPQGGAWNIEADDGTPLPFITFRALTAGYNYTFGPDDTPPSDERYPYELKAWAEDLDGQSATDIVAALTGHIRRVLTDATLIITGYTLLVCRPYTGIPPSISQGPNARDQLSQGARFEIIVTQP